MPTVPVRDKLAESKMPDRELTMLTLARGETRRVLVEAGTVVLVISGSLVLRGPLQWLAETIVAPEQRLGPEQGLALASGGWVDLLAGDGVQVVLLPRARQKLWRQVARCLESLLGSRTCPDA
jgi:hypothetical protein